MLSIKTPTNPADEPWLKTGGEFCSGTPQPQKVKKPREVLKSDQVENPPQADSEKNLKKVEKKA